MTLARVYHDESARARCIMTVSVGAFSKKIKVHSIAFLIVRHLRGFSLFKSAQLLPYSLEKGKIIIFRNHQNIGATWQYTLSYRKLLAILQARTPVAMVEQLVD